MTKKPSDGSSLKVPSGVHAMRRGGARREVTERVLLRREGEDPSVPLLEGWALNVSRGGLRAILEEKVALGEKFDIGIGADDVSKRSGRVVWVQEEPDGVIVGFEFTSLSGLHKAATPVTGGAAEGEDASTSVPPARDPERD